MHYHRLVLLAERQEAAATLDRPHVESTVDITANSSDLVAAVAELLSRLPDDLYSAFKAAMKRTES